MTSRFTTAQLSSLILFFSILIAFPACKSLKKIGSGNKAMATLEQAKANNLEFETMKIKGKGKAAVPGQGFSFGIGYKIEIASHDKMRIRITKLGLEGARILITQDSIFVLDRLSKKAYLAGFGMAQQFTGIEADFDLLQSMIVGDFRPIPSDLELKEKMENAFTYIGQVAGTDFLYKISTDLMKMTGMEAKNVSQNVHTEVNFSAFEEEEGQQIASEGAVTVYSPEEASFSFSHSDVEINPNKISFAFKIPKNYEVVAN